MPRLVSNGKNRRLWDACWVRDTRERHRSNTRVRTSSRSLGELIATVEKTWSHR